MGYNNTPNVIVQIDNKAIREQQEKADRQTQVINQGTSLITADQTTPLDIQVEGRTLVPLQNSNLESGGTYVLANADKKSKVIVDNKPVSGVAKLTKNSTLTRKTTFAGKVAGSNVDNPLNFYSRNGGSMAPIPHVVGTSVIDQNQTSIDRVKTVDGQVVTHTTSASGSITQHIFSFDMIQEVERNMGIIPGSTTAQKVQWLKDNASNLSFKWWGNGFGPNGAKAWHAVYHSVNNTWTMGWNNHTASVVQIMTTNILDFANRIDANGFVHVVAYSDASDGVTASTITTDAVEFILDLKTTAQLDTRPQLSRVVNMEGKVSGSLVELPHLYRHSEYTALALPTAGGWTEFVTDRYSWISKLDGVLSSKVGTVDGTARIAQALFSFDVIAEIERNLGRIPKATLPDKIQWCKDNLSNLAVKWHGFGSSVGGNKAIMSIWNGTNWIAATNHNLGTVYQLSFISKNISGWIGNGTGTAGIGSDGMFHVLAHTEISDGVVAPAINTDYIELEIELKPGAVLQDPQVPLYQVDSTEYTKILGEWPEAEVLTRYPKTTGIQHVQNPYIVAEGENLLPPFYEWDDMSSGKATILDPYKVMLKQAVAGQRMAVYIPAIEGQTYTFSANKDTGNGLVYFYFCDAAKNRLTGGITHKSGTAPAGAKLMEVIVNPDAPIGDYGFSNPMMTLGSVEKPFVPKNPSFLFAQVKLGQIGSVKDALYKADGWKVRKNIEKDVIMDGTLAWSYYANRTSFKTFKIPKFNPDMIKYPSILTGHEGQRIPANETSNIDLEVYRQQSVDSYFYMNADNAKTGMGATYVPVDDEVKAYFNGWQAKTVDGTGKPTSWRSLGDGVDAPTQTLAYVKANKAPNFTPYKISYVLDVSVVEDVSDKVEGDIAVAGITQVEVGSGVIVREKVTPRVDGTARTLVDGSSKWNGAYWAGSRVLYSVSKWLKMYKNGVPDEAWRIGATNNTMFLPQDKYDTAAEYKVTYIVGDKNLFSVNPFNLKATYAKNIRSALEDTVKKVEDNTKDISVNVQAIAELYKRIKGLGG